LAMIAGKLGPKEPQEMERPKTQILVIEDDHEMRSLLKDFIEEEDGFEVDWVIDGSEAIPKLSKKPFDLIITDLRMPGLNGMDIIPGLKNIQPGIPIIVITAFGSEEINRRVFARGASAYLEKPIPLDRLRGLIHDFLERRRV
jgi:DNA-binding NtrC family response regulator